MSDEGYAGLRWYVQTLTRDIGSETWLGYTAAIASLPIIIFSPLGGTIADRFSKRWVIVCTQSVDMILAFMLGILVAMQALPMWAVLVFAALHGSFLAFDIPARQAFAIEMVGRRDLMSAIAINSTSFNLGRLLGPMAAGWAIAIAGIAMCFVLNGLSFLGLICVLIFLPLPKREKRLEIHATRPQHWSDILQGFRAVFTRPKLRALLGTLSLFLITGGGYQTLLAALADYKLGAQVGGYGILLTANGLGSVVGALCVASIHNVRSREIPIVLGLILVAIGVIATSQSPNLTLASISLFIAGAGFILFLASTNSTIQLDVPDQLRGRVMSVWVLVFGASLPVGSLLVGQLAHWVGTRNAILTQGLGTLLAVMLALVALRLPDPQSTLDQD